jgi:acetone carboxylase gamma subunit
MQIKERIILQHSNGLYLNRKADGHVKEPEVALRFTDHADASQWLLNAYIAPKDTESYKYITIEIITRLKELVENE